MIKSHLKCVLYFTLFPVVVIMHCFYARNRIRILYLYLVKHRKEIKAYKKLKSICKSKRKEMKTLSDETLIDFCKTLGGKKARLDFKKKEEFSKLILHTAKQIYKKPFSKFFFYLFEPMQKAGKKIFICVLFEPLYWILDTIYNVKIFYLCFKHKKEIDLITQEQKEL